MLAILAVCVALGVAVRLLVALELRVAVTEAEIDGVEVPVRVGSVELAAQGAAVLALQVASVKEASDRLNLL